MDTHVCMKYRWIGDPERPLPWEQYSAAKRAVLYRPRDCTLLEEFIMLGPVLVLSSRRCFSFIYIFIYLDSVLRDAVRRFGCPDAVLLRG